MNKNKGVVLEIEGQRAIVLGPGGEFRSVRLRHPVQVGDEIELTVEKAAVLSSWRNWLSAVAAVFLLLAVLPVWQHWNQPALGPVVTFLSLDINPSFQLGLDEQNRVVEEKGLNQEARELLASTPIHGLAAAEAVNRLTRAAEEAGYLGQNGSPQIILAVASKQGEAKAAQIAALLRQQTREFLERQQLQVAMKTVVTVPQAIQIAAGQGLSLGKLAQNIEAKKQKTQAAAAASVNSAPKEPDLQQASAQSNQMQPGQKPGNKTSGKSREKSTNRQPVKEEKPAATTPASPAPVAQPGAASGNQPAASQPEDQGIVYITEIDLSLGGEGGSAETAEPASSNN